MVISLSVISVAPAMAQENGIADCVDAQLERAVNAPNFQINAAVDLLVDRLRTDRMIPLRDVTTLLRTSPEKALEILNMMREAKLTEFFEYVDHPERGKMMRLTGILRSDPANPFALDASKDITTAIKQSGGWMSITKISHDFYADDRQATWEYVKLLSRAGILKVVDGYQVYLTPEASQNLESFQRSRAAAFRRLMNDWHPYPRD
jgi:hypothetical protein